VAALNTAEAVCMREAVAAVSVAALALHSTLLGNALASNSAASAAAAGTELETLVRSW
jgi:hypothetical protein